MELFFQFVSHQWYLFGVLLLLLAALAYHESRKAGPQLSPQQVSMLINKDDALVLDVRPSKEYQTGHIVDAINIPFNEVGQRSAQLDKYRGRPLVLVCKMGQHSGSIAKQLKERGFDPVYRLRGGMMEWASSQMPTVKG